MSYIRAGHPMKFVEGDSNDYVFLSTGCSCEKLRDAVKRQELNFECPDHPNFIEDYGELTNEGLVEIFARWFKTEDRELYDYILKKLAEKLNVKLRETPHDESQSFLALYKLQLPRFANNNRSFDFAIGSALYSAPYGKFLSGTSKSASLLQKWSLTYDGKLGQYNEAANTLKNP